MKIRNWGMVLLAAWLVLSGLAALLGFNAPVIGAALAVLGIVAGGIIFFDVVKGPTTPRPDIDTDPKKYIGTDCLPKGDANYPGIKLKVIDKKGATVHEWSFKCDDVATLIAELKRIEKSYCQGKDGTTKAGKVGGTDITPYHSTSANIDGIALTGSKGNWLFNCSAVPALIEALEGAFKNCCA
jgi:hypothetical protein